MPAKSFLEFWLSRYPEVFKSVGFAAPEFAALAFGSLECLGCIFETSRSHLAIDFRVLPPDVIEHDAFAAASEKLPFAIHGLGGWPGFGFHSAQVLRKMGAPGSSAVCAD